MSSDFGGISSATRAVHTTEDEIDSS